MGRVVIAEEMAKLMNETETKAISTGLDIATEDPGAHRHLRRREEGEGVGEEEEREEGE